MPRRRSKEQMEYDRRPKVYGPPKYDLKGVFPMTVEHVLDTVIHVNQPTEFRMMVKAEHTGVSGCMSVSINKGAERRFVLPRAGDRLWVAATVFKSREYRLATNGKSNTKKGGDQDDQRTIWKPKASKV